MNEQQQQQEMVQRVMGEIVRWYQKLAEGGFATGTIEAKSVPNLVEGTLVYKDQLILNGEVIAELTRVETKPLDQVQSEAEAKQAEIQAQADTMKSAFDEVIAVVKPLAEKKPVTKEK